MTSSVDRTLAKLGFAKALVVVIAAGACLACAPRANGAATAAEAARGPRSAARAAMLGVDGLGVTLRATSAPGAVAIPAAPRAVSVPGGSSPRAMALGAASLGAPSGPPARLLERATAAIAERWGVEPAALVLSLGPWSESLAPLEIEAPLRLSGRGHDGRFAVVLLPGRGRAVTLVVRAGHRDSIPVATRALELGHCLVAGDVRLEARVIWGPPVARPEEIAGPGWEVRRPLSAGEPLTHPVVAPPELVAAGDPVRLVWARGTVSIALDGLALHGARRGERVSARVPGRTERVRGIVVAPGTAELDSEVAR